MITIDDNIQICNSTAVSSYPLVLITMIRRLNLHQYHHVFDFIALWTSHLAKPLGFWKIIVLRRGTGVSFELKFLSLPFRNLVQVSWAKGVNYAI